MKKREKKKEHSQSEIARANRVESTNVGGWISGLDATLVPLYRAKECK